MTEEELLEGLEDKYGPLPEAQPNIAPVEIPESVELRQFKPGINVHETLGLTQFIFEDVAAYASPCFPRTGHVVDWLLAMDDHRVVGVQVWAIPPDRKEVVQDTGQQTPHETPPQPPAEAGASDLDELIGRLSLCVGKFTSVSDAQCISDSADAIASLRARVAELEKERDTDLEGCYRTMGIQADRIRQQDDEIAALKAERDKLWEAAAPFVRLADSRDRHYRKRGGDPDTFPDAHPSYDIYAEKRELPLGAWRKLRAAIADSPPQSAEKARALALADQIENAAPGSQLLCDTADFLRGLAGEMPATADPVGCATLHADLAAQDGPIAGSADLVRALKVASTMCGNVIFNGSQVDIPHERHMRAWRDVKADIDDALAKAEGGTA